MNYQYFFSWRTAILKSGLPSTTRHVLLTLSCHMNEAGESCYPSIELLCEETGLSNRAVITHLDKAREAGWIKIDKHGFRGQKWARNEYQIAWPNFDKPEEKVVNDVHHLSDEGSEPNDKKAVNDVHTSTSVNSSVLLTSVSNSPRVASNAQGISFDSVEGLFRNIFDVHLRRWEEAYPKLDIDAELAKAESWYMANPRKRKKNHERFITNWLARANDRMVSSKQQKPYQAAVR